MRRIFRVAWMVFLLGVLCGQVVVASDAEPVVGSDSGQQSATQQVTPLSVGPDDTTWAEVGISAVGQYFRNLDEYVSPSTGLLTVYQVDLTTAGPGPRLSLARIYQTPGLFKNGEPNLKVFKAYANLGRGWSLDLPWIHENELCFLRGQRFKISWTTVNSQLAKFENHKNAHFLLTKNLVNGVTDHYELTTSDGVLYYFDKYGYITRVSDPNGYALTYTLEDMPSGTLPEGYCRSLLQISDSMGRTITLAHVGTMMSTATLAGPDGESRTVRYDCHDSGLYGVYDPISVATGEVDGHRTEFSYDPHNPWLLMEIKYPTGWETTYLHNSLSRGYGDDEYTKHLVGWMFRPDRIQGFDYTMQTEDYWFRVASTEVTTKDPSSDAVVMKESFALENSEYALVTSHSIQDVDGTEVRRYVYTYNGNKERTSKVETRVGSATAQTKTEWWYDNWGNLTEERDALSQSRYYTYVNSTATQAGTPDWVTWTTASTDFYPNSVDTKIRNRLAGTFYYQNKEKTKRVDSYFKYEPSGNLIETKQRLDDGAPWSKTAYHYGLAASGIMYGPASVVRGYGLPPDEQIETSIFYDVPYRAFPVGTHVDVEDLYVNRVHCPYSPVITSQTYYSDIGAVASRTDANGNTTEFQYDLLGRPTLMLYPDRPGESGRLAAQIEYHDSPLWSGSYVVVSYGVWDSTSGLSEKRLIKKYRLDGLGRQVGAESFASSADYPNAPTSRRSVTYNWQGLIASETISGSSTATAYTTRHDYDLFGRRVKVTNPDGTYRQTAYDDAADLDGSVGADGYVTTVLDERGHRKDSAYDWLGRLTRVVEHKGDAYPIITTYEYDSAANLVKLTDGRGLVTTYGYDQLNRLVRTTLPGGLVETLAYDPLGRLVSKKDRSGRILTSYHNQLDLLVKQEAQKQGDSSAREIARFGYDPAGNQVLSVAGNITYWRTFDTLNRVTGEETTVNGRTYTTGYNYDASGFLTGLVSPGGKTTGYEYFDDGELKAVRRGPTASDPLIASYQYWPFGMVKDIAFGNGAATSLQLDSTRPRIDRITTRLSTGDILLDFAYAFEDDGDIRSINCDEFRYDALGRLVDSVVY